MNTDFSYIRYLKAKKSIDDRFLNRYVYSTMLKHLPCQYPDKPLHILEIGSGIGTMIERLIDWDLLHHINYTTVEIDINFINEGISRLQTYASENNWHFNIDSENTREQNIHMKKQSRSIELRFIHGDFQQEQYTGGVIPDQDLVIAHTMLDIFNLPTAVEKIISLLKPNGIFWFTMNYDGLTRFIPRLEGELDQKIELLYNNSMDKKDCNERPRGGSKAGSRMFDVINRSGGSLLAAGSSDWIITPVDKGYTEDEIYFIRSILFTVVSALQDHPELGDRELESWLENRLEQLEKGELSFIAHQLDFVGHK